REKDHPPTHADRLVNASMESQDVSRATFEHWRPGAHCRAAEDSEAACMASDRSDVVASPQPVCAVCGGPRGSRKREACSDRCRTELSRRRRKDALRRRDGEIRALLATALRKLEEGAP